MLTFSDAPEPSGGAPNGINSPVSSFDWSTRLSLDTIRQHTKTDDIPGVTDDQLHLYRMSSLEAAEMYTGMLLQGQRSITEPIEAPAYARANHYNPYAYVRPHKMHYIHNLRYPVADGYVNLYGSPYPTHNRTIAVTPGSRTIKVPIVTGLLDLSNCCDPCSKSHYNGGMVAAYNAGFKSPADVPAGVVLGCLQFLAWIVEHPGDELLTQRNRKDNSTKIGGVSGSNNIAMVSGALEQWRNYDESAI